MKRLRARLRLIRLAPNAASFYVSDKNTKEIGHFFALFFFYKILCFGQNFLTHAIFSNPLLQAIYILPVLCRDTHIDHIYGHINPYKNGHYGYFAEIGHYGLTYRVGRDQFFIKKKTVYLAKYF